MAVLVNSDSLSIYLHLPFCRSRCAYCDFNTYAGFESYIPAYVRSLKKEIEIAGHFIKGIEEIQSVYFGGGTPTLLKAYFINDFIQKVRETFKFTPVVEITSEANPCELTKDYLTSLVAAGVNRLSIGMQSAVSRELKLLGRRHTREDTANAVDSARQAGFKNINLDLIFGIPEQTLASFRESLTFALDLQPEHLSLYALTLEETTPLAGQVRKGEISAIDDDLAGDMYSMAMEMLVDWGFIQYEISNWSLSGRFECTHNLQYWRNLHYLGFGAGAHSHYNKIRWENCASIKKYISSLKTVEPERFPAAAAEINQLDKQTLIQETIMMGLRLTREGLIDSQFICRFGMSIEDLFENEIRVLIDQGLLEWAVLEKERHLRLTRRGRMLGNQVFMRFMGD